MTEEDEEKDLKKSYLNEAGERVFELGPSDPVKACWLCYKLVPLSTLIFDCITEKRFCSRACAIKYADEHCVDCANHKGEQ